MGTVAEEPVPEESVETVAEEPVAEEPLAEEPVAAEPVPEEPVAVVSEAMEADEDGPLDDWTVKELKEECKTLGLSEKGKKAELIERIKETKATPDGPLAKEQFAEVPVAEEAEEMEEPITVEPVAEELV